MKSPAIHSPLEPSARAKWFAGSVVIAYAFISLIPLVWIFMTSFRTPEDAIAYPPKVIGQLQMPASMIGPPEAVAVSRGEKFAIVTAAQKFNPADPMHPAQEVHVLAAREVRMEADHHVEEARRARTVVTTALEAGLDWRPAPHSG